ncbi:MAG: hypothetical protein P9L97_01270 [Candidatus Tenebribacter davisii]|jgi:hypothetical protein|nr:hypothetical protein [Candidatus Tenebribacter davisii]
MKKLIISLMAVLMLSTLVTALTLDNLDIPDKMTVEEYLIDNFDSITSINIENLEGIEYTVLAVGEKWVIVVVGNDIFVILK